MENDPDTLVDLLVTRTDFEAEVIVRALEGRGIPAKTFTRAAAMLTWEISATNPIRVSVRRKDLDAARAALAQIEAESLEIDWANVDTGDRAPVTIDESRAAGDESAASLARRRRRVLRLTLLTFLALLAVLLLSVLGSFSF